MKINIKTNLKGYFPVQRALFLLAKMNLTSSELFYYLFFASQADFDKRHERFGVIIRDDRELAESLGCNEITIYRKRKTLIKKGFLYEEGGLTKITNMLPFQLSYAKKLAGLSPTKLQYILTKRTDEVAELLEKITEMQTL